jgi:hypothetical protein
MARVLYYSTGDGFIALCAKHRQDTRAIIFPLMSHGLADDDCTYCLEEAKEAEARSFDAVVSNPPITPRGAL